MTVAFVFPGQGSQSVGMMNSLAASSPIIAATFAEASAVLGYDLWQVVVDGPEERLNQTEVTQPAMLAAGIATWRFWLAEGGSEPALVAGHSLGEYSALVAAGALAFTDAIALVAARGRAMQQAVNAGEGAMAAILGLDDARVIACCHVAAESEVVAAVNFNAPGQVVIAGHRAAVERAVAACKVAGAKRAVLLPVSVPSHCALMAPAAAALEAVLASCTVTAPRIAVINNVDVAAAAEPAEIRAALVRQLYSPVRWVETIQQIEARGATKIIECGPGKVLTGLNKRCVKEAATLAIVDPASLASALT
jgi:[acyl-carrier-protein] S-malonyltransferase